MYSNVFNLFSVVGYFGRAALEGDRASDAELQKLAQRLVKPDGEAWEEEELVDIRLAEDLKRRRQQKRSR